MYLHFFVWYKLLSTLQFRDIESSLLIQYNILLYSIFKIVWSGELAEVGKRYWVKESSKVPLVAKTAERLKVSSNCGFVKISELNEEIPKNKEILPVT